MPGVGNFEESLLIAFDRHGGCLEDHVGILWFTPKSLVSVIRLVRDYYYVPFIHLCVDEIPHFVGALFDFGRLVEVFVRASCKGCHAGSKQPRLDSGIPSKSLCIRLLEQRDRDLIPRRSEVGLFPINRNPIIHNNALPGIHTKPNPIQPRLIHFSILKQPFKDLWMLPSDR